MPTEDAPATPPPSPPVIPLPELVAKVYAVLEPLPSEMRQRVVAATLVMLGENTSHAPSGGAARPGSRSNSRQTDEETGADEGFGDLPGAAKKWLQHHAISMDVVNNHFHFDEGEVKLFASPAQGKSKREQTIATYLLVGLAALFKSGTASFTDEDARTQCEEFGCYDTPNHAKYLNGAKGQMTGSKAGGWKLTHPGLSAAAELLNPKTGG